MATNRFQNVWNCCWQTQDFQSEKHFSHYSIRVCFLLWITRLIFFCKLLIWAQRRGWGEEKGESWKLNFMFDDSKFVFRILGDWHFSRSTCHSWFTDGFLTTHRPQKWPILALLPLKFPSDLVITLRLKLRLILCMLHTKNKFTNVSKLILLIEILARMILTIVKPQVCNVMIIGEWRMPPGGRVLSYMGYIVMCRCEGYGFQAVYSRIGYINQSIWV